METGRVLEVGSGVTKYKVGDNVAVGCMVDSCLSCDQCHNGEEQFCREGMVGTYSGQDRISGELTQGGYSKHIVVREEFVLNVPKGLDLAKCAPILCAGITTYSPLRTWNVGPGSRVGGSRGSFRWSDFRGSRSSNSERSSDSLECSGHRTRLATAREL